MTDNSNTTGTVKQRKVREQAQINLEIGVLLLQCHTLAAAIRDARLQRPHLRVLLEFGTAMNNKTAMAWPSYETLSTLTGLSEKHIRSLVSELRSLGYLVSERERVPEAGNRVLTVTTFCKLTREQMQGEWTKYCNAIRDTTINKTVQPGVDSASTTVQPGVDNSKKVVQPGVDSASTTVQPGVDSADTISTQGWTPVSTQGWTSNLSIGTYEEEGAAATKVNAVADKMCADVERWFPGGDKQAAAEWLATTLAEFGETVTREAWLELKSKMATGYRSANLLTSWVRFAANVRDRKKADLNAAKAANEKMDALELLPGETRWDARQRLKAKGGRK
jgi:hypothetical protein